VIGKTITHYRILGRLGAGGMGVVYEAQDEQLPRRVALKLLAGPLASDPTAIRHLKREAGLLAAVNHPHVCTIFEVGDLDGQPFIVMERLEGQTLRVRLARAKLTTTAIVDIAAQVASALEAAHDRGIVHRDIKPGNIFVTTDGVVKVLDFGLARQIPHDDAGPGMYGSTIAGRPMGTANYMAPERILQLPLDARCDLFSLGVVMYEMATGRQPFAADATADVVRKVLDFEPLAVHERSPEHPAALGEIVSKLMAKPLGDRFQSAADLQGALARLKRYQRPTR
jgi:serine/threonine protein kinase